MSPKRKRPGIHAIHAGPDVSEADVTSAVGSSEGLTEMASNILRMHEEVTIGIMGVLIIRLIPGDMTATIGSFDAERITEKMRATILNEAAQLITPHLIPGTPMVMLVLADPWDSHGWIFGIPSLSLEERAALELVN